MGDFGGARVFLPSESVGGDTAGASNLHVTLLF